MKQSIWVRIVRAVVMLVVVVALVAAAWGAILVGKDLVVTYEEWDGLGVLFGMLILAVSLPIVVVGLVFRHLLRGVGPARG